MKKKIWCFNNGGSVGWYTAMALCEDGHVLAQHVCSDEGYMAHDLGLVGNWKHENYNAHCGVGNWELVWVDEPRTHPGVQSAYNLNQQLAQSEAGAA